MSYMQGIGVGGMTFSGRKDFQSFNGLSLWLDPRVGIKLVQSDTRIQSLQERSAFNINTMMPSLSEAARLSSTGAFQLIKSIDSSRLTIGSADWARFNFLTGSYSLFYVSKILSGASISTNYYRPLGLKQGSTSSDGFINWVPVNDVLYTTRRLRTAMANNAGTTILNVTSADNVYTHDVFHIFEHHIRGYNVAGNDCELYVDNALVASGNFTGAPTTNTVTSFRIVESTVGNAKYAECALLLCYNNSGKSLAQIDTDRADIYALIANLYSTIF
ncbi:MAG: hypothetical protein ACXWXW_00780 [Bacteroidia bacterium]